MTQNHALKTSNVFGTATQTQILETKRESSLLVMVSACVTVKWFQASVISWVKTGLCNWASLFLNSQQPFLEKKNEKLREKKVPRNWRRKKWGGWCCSEELCCGLTSYCQLLVAFSCFLGFFVSIHDCKNGYFASWRQQMVQFFTLNLSCF